MSPSIYEIFKLYVFAQGCPPQSSCGGGVESVVNVTLNECAMACIVSKPRGAQQTNMQKPQNRLAINRQLCKRPEHQKVASDATNLSGCKPLDDNHALANTGEITWESKHSSDMRWYCKIRILDKSDRSVSPPGPLQVISQKCHTRRLCTRSPWVDKLQIQCPRPTYTHGQAFFPFHKCAGQAFFPFHQCASVLDLELSSPWILLLLNEVGACARI